jgi:hypothetical protein
MKKRAGLFASQAMEVTEQRRVITRMKSAKAVVRIAGSAGRGFCGIPDSQQQSRRDPWCVCSGPRTSGLQCRDEGRIRQKLPQTLPQRSWPATESPNVPLHPPRVEGTFYSTILRSRDPWVQHGRIEKAESPIARHCKALQGLFSRLATMKLPPPSLHRWSQPMWP